MSDAAQTLESLVPETPISFSNEAVMDRWKDGFKPPETPAVSPEPEVKPAPTTEAKVESKPDSSIPDSILGIEKKVDAEPDILTVEPTGPLKHENYKKLQQTARERVEKATKELEALRAEYSEFKSKTNPDALPEKWKGEYEGLKKTLAERNEELGRLAVERTDEFKERFTNRQKGIAETLKKTAAELEIRPDQLTQLLASEGKRRFELMEEIDAPQSAKSYITALLKDHDQIEYDKSAYMEDWQGRLSKAEQAKLAEDDSRKAKLKEYEDRVFDQTWDESSKTYGAIAKIDGNEQWNRGVDEIREQAKRFMDGEFSPEEYAKVTIAGLSAPRIYQMFEYAKGKLQEALAENQSLKAAGPSAPPPGSKVTTPDDSKLSQEDRFKATFDRIVSGAANNGF